MAKKYRLLQPTPKLALIALTLSLFSLFLPTATPSPVKADTEDIKWSRVNIPANGEAGNWLLAGGSDIHHLTAAPDGSLYACAEGLANTLYKSADGGHRWSIVGNVTDSIISLAFAPNNANYIYYATRSTVFRSTDGGRTFSPLPPAPGGAGSNNVEITSIAVGQLNNVNIIAAGTRDTDSGQYGGVYTLKEEIGAGWVNTGIGSYDVYAVAFPPDYVSHGQLLAVVTNEVNTLVTARIGEGVWGAAMGNARLNKDNTTSPTPVVVGVSAAIAFPSDYSSEASAEECCFFVAIDTGTNNGDVYKIKGADSPNSSTATDLNIGLTYGIANVDVTGLAVSGTASEARVLAGATRLSQAYFSPDAGKSWSRSRKEPTGESRTYVLISAGPGAGIFYSATSGSESAVSMSRDNGTTWNQIGLIDTGLSTLIDVAPSPAYDEDNTLFLLSFGSKSSLWRSSDGALTWERTYSSALANVDTLTLLRISPQYNRNRKQVLYLAGASNGSPAVWQSTNNGQTFLCRPAHDPATGAPINVDLLTVFSDDAYFIGSFDGSRSRVYRTTSGGFIYSAGAPVGSQLLYSLALSPDYEKDRTILLGNNSGWVYISFDDGASFKPLPSDAAAAPLTGSISVAFDPNFSGNKIVYASSTTANKGVFRMKTGAGNDWESIDGTLPSGAILNKLIISGDGALYAANVAAGKGIERCLNPTLTPGPTFETFTSGLNSTATLSGLWQGGQNLWSIDSTNTKLLSLPLRLTSPVALSTPSNKTAAIGNLVNHTISNISVSWQAQKGATTYRWQLDYNNDFLNIPAGFEGTCQGTTIRLPTLEPSTTYYWRVSATEPVLSPWSDKWSFTTSLDTEAIAIKLDSPAAGGRETPVRPVFQWSALTDAAAYELLVATDVNFANPAITKTGDFALNTPTWPCNINLDYETTYFWKIRAVSANTRSAWSSIGSFTTESVLKSAPPPPAPPAPAPPMTQATFAVSPLILSPNAPGAFNPAEPAAPLPTTASPALPTVMQVTIEPGWTVYLLAGLLLVVVLLLIITLLLVGQIRRF